MSRGPAAHATVNGGVLAPKCRPGCRTGGLDRSSNVSLRGLPGSPRRRAVIFAPLPMQDRGATRQAALPIADALKPTVMERHAVERGDRNRMTPRALSVAVLGTPDGVVAQTFGRVIMDTATSGNNGGSGEKPHCPGDLTP